MERGAQFRRPNDLRRHNVDQERHRAVARLDDALDCHDACRCGHLEDLRLGRVNRTLPDLACSHMDLDTDPPGEGLDALEFLESGLHERHAWAANVPIPCRRTMRPPCSGCESASRRVARLTPRRELSAASEGNVPSSPANDPRTESRRRPPGPPAGPASRYAEPCPRLASPALPEWMAPPEGVQTAGHGDVSAGGPCRSPDMGTRVRLGRGVAINPTDPGVRR